MADEIELGLAIRAHEASAQQWYLTEEAVNQLVDELPGKPVTFNYQGEPIGTVVSAKRDDSGVVVTLTVVDPQVRSILGRDGYGLGPALFNDKATPAMRSAGEYPMGKDWHVQRVGVVPTKPPDEPAVIAPDDPPETS